MPPKDYDPLSQGTLFFSSDGGETYAPVGKVQEEGLIIDDLVPEDGEELPSSVFRSMKQCREMSFTCAFNIIQNPSVFMFLWKGKWPSNNWLKMHGFPMRRKKGKRRW